MSLTNCYLLFALFCALGQWSHSMPCKSGRDSGDIILRDGSNTTKSIIGDALRWPGQTVPYMISSSFLANETSIIDWAISEISNKTCIKFIPRSSQTDYVYIRRGQPSSGCWSDIGRIGGRQILNLQPPPGTHCIWRGIVAHEMIHALGFYHEQVRSDRDDFVTIIWSNIPRHAHSNFQKLPSSQMDTFGVDYDYKSIMHYGAHSFAINTTIPTIVPKKNVEIGQRCRLSEGDINKIKNKYKC